MSGSHPVNPAAGQGGADPSMEDILASIRRILSEDEAPGARRPDAGQPATPHMPEMSVPQSLATSQKLGASAPSRPDDVLALDETMLVREPQRTPSHSPLAALGSFMSAPTQPDARMPPPVPPPVPASVTVTPIMPVAAVAPPPPEPTPTPLQPPATVEKAVPMAPADHPLSSAPGGSSLVAPEAAAAASASMGNLLRSLSAERHTPVHRGGPSIEDIVRDEMRPMLKQWLDTHLPGLVERLVRSEIERMSGHAKP